MKQIKKDAYFLAKLNIMDYSLLIGIHDRDKRGEVNEILAPIPHPMDLTSTSVAVNLPACSGCAGRAVLRLGSVGRHAPHGALVHAVEVEAAPVVAGVLSAKTRGEEG